MACVSHADFPAQSAIEYEYAERAYPYARNGSAGGFLVQGEGYLLCNRDGELGAERWTAGHVPITPEVGTSQEQWQERLVFVSVYKTERGYDLITCLSMEKGFKKLWSLLDGKPEHWVDSPEWEMT